MLRLLALVGLVATCWACTDSLGDAPGDLNELRKDVPLSEGHDVQYVYTDSGYVKARVDAPHMLELLEPRSGGETYRYLDQTFKARLYDREGNLVSTITANEGRIWQDRGEAVARGNVVVKNVDGEMLETEELHWDQRRDRISTKAKVKITRPGEVVYGQGLVSNTAFSDYTITKMTGIVNVGDE